MDRSKHQCRSNKGFINPIAILIASVLLLPWALAQGAIAQAGTQATQAAAPNAAASAAFVPASAPVVDDIPGAGHLNDPVPDANAPVTDDIPGAGHLIDDPNDPAATKGDLAAGNAPGLQLDVLINGYKIDLVAAFSQMPDGEIASSRSELRELGLKIPGSGPDGEVIRLASVPGLTYDYNAAEQTIDLKISDAGREAKSITILPKKELLPAESDTGLVLNYSGFGAANYDLGGAISHFDGASVSVDARAFSRFGVIQQTGIVGTTTFSDFSPVRLDTTWSYSSQDRAETYKVGDIISGGLGWTRPVRFGGGQVQRNFGVRPDLITRPLPSLVGSAAVPSTLDVYINGAKTYSHDIEPGPFSIDQLPIITSQGNARVVLTDTTGRQTQSETPIYSSPDLLAPHLFDYSLDLGVARRGYGTDSFDYDNQLMAIASARYGVTDYFTAEAHVEARQDLFEGGLGGLFVAGPFGTFNAAAAVSDFQGDIGFYGYGAWEFEYKNLLVRASTAHTFGNFVDLAAITETPLAGVYKNGVPQAIDQITASYGFTDFDAGAGLSLVHITKHDGEDSILLGANVTKSFGSDISVYANAYVDLENTSDYGAFVGFSMPLGKDVSVSTGASMVKGSWAATTEATKPLDTSYGSYGYRVSALDQQGNAQVAAEGSYRSAHALTTGRVSSTGGRISGNASVDGSIVATKAGLFLGNPISDSFAIVDAGAENVDVSYENRFVGKTGKGGKLLISQLRAYQSNKISIDPNGLPINATISETEKYTAPREKSGVLVDFGVKKDGNSLIVILKDADGKFLSPGTKITIAGKSEPFLMGYDGEVFLTDVGEHNSLTAEGATSTCSVNFDFKADETTQTSIGPLQCL